MTKLEEVARALCCRNGCHITRVNERAETAQLYDVPWSCLWESKIDDVRAALEALREPNEAMLRAALSVLRSDLKESEASIALTTEAVLRVMIDAILKEKPE